MISLPLELLFLISNQLCDLVWNNIEMVWAIQIIFAHVSVLLFIPRFVNYFLKDFSTIFHVVKETKINALSAMEKHKGERGLYGEKTFGKKTYWEL